MYIRKRRMISTKSSNMGWNFRSVMFGTILGSFLIQWHNIQVDKKGNKFRIKIRIVNALQ